MSTAPVPRRRLIIRKVEAPATPATPGVPATPMPPLSSETEPNGYDVGYKKPPKAKQFKPGQSGNPKGRPKGAKGMNTIVRDLLTEKVTVRTSVGAKRMSKMEAALHKLTEKAFTGDVRALGALIQLYKSSVPEDLLAANDVGHSPNHTEQDDAALEALRDLIRDEVQSAHEGDA